MYDIELRRQLHIANLADQLDHYLDLGGFYHHCDIEKC
jgi:hypothetical protein